MGSINPFAIDSTFKEGDIYIVEAAATEKGASPKTSTLTIRVQIYSGDIQIVNGDPFNYPNPFDPMTGTTIKYYLSDNADSKIMIYNSDGKPVKRFVCPVGTLGGQQDINLVPWDGRDNLGNLVANGPYLYFIIVDGKVIGKGEMCAFK